MMPRATCGSCTACCSLLGVHELEKPPGRACSHCDAGKGCKVYDDRPASCQRFECLFLRDNLDMQLRPDQCNVVLFQQGDLIFAAIDRNHPNAWTSEPVSSLLARFVAAGRTVILSLAEGTYLMSQNMTARKVAITMRAA